MCAYYKSAEFAKLRSRATAELQKLFTLHSIPDSHGLGHAQAVAAHMMRAVQSHEAQAKSHELSSNRLAALFLAALLHDADDHKFFSKDTSGAEAENAQKISAVALEGYRDMGLIVSEVVEMISYVSMSANGNSIPARAAAEPEFLWPRFCDRLEAIGTIGIIRTYQYNTEKGLSLSCPISPRPKSEEEVWSYVTPARMEAYCINGSASMMDHFYDKLLQIPAGFRSEVVQNEYLSESARQRVQPMLQVCLEFGKNGEVPIKTLESLVKQESRQ